MDNYKETYVGDVTLVEKPVKSNGYFYIVQGSTGDPYHVSALFGKVAQMGKLGRKYKLYIRSNNFTTFYFLKE